MLKEIILFEHFHTSVIKNVPILKGEELNACTQEYFFPYDFRRTKNPPQKLSGETFFIT